MNDLRLPNNIKVHYGGTEKLWDARLLVEMGISYGLYTAFPFINGGRCSASDMSLPAYLCEHMSHVIQDSGLFTMLFGKHSGSVAKSDVFRWYDSLVDWTLSHGQRVTCVEVDAQSIVGVEETWKMRERMRRDLPNNRIINVFHLQDGRYGLDRMIEYSDYIAIGLPELRSVGKKDYALPLARYIKEKKPDIDIHLLGFTDFAHIRRFRFCTSCDSVTWLSARRFGEIDSIYRAEDFDTEKVRRMVGAERHDKIRGANGSGTIANAMAVNLELWKHKTTMLCGDQDLKWFYKG